MQKGYFKIALMGDAQEKTELRNRFMGRGFRQEHLMTIGADFASKEMTIDGTKVTFEVWDLKGGETFKRERSRFFRGATAGLLVYDVNINQTFMNLTGWIEELWRNCGRGVIPIAILALQSDNRQENSVPVENGEKYASQLSEKVKPKGYVVNHYESSAKTGLNVDLAFADLGGQIIAAVDRGQIKFGS